MKECLDGRYCKTCYTYNIDESFCLNCGKPLEIRTPIEQSIKAEFKPNLEAFEELKTLTVYKEKVIETTK